jgi:hypothetical protein
MYGFPDVSEIAGRLETRCREETGHGHLHDLVTELETAAAGAPRE